MILISIFEILGTIAFAISGALIGIEKKLDLFGVIFLSITTSVGGGIFRDLIIGNTPPAAFTKPIYCMVSIGAGMFTFMFYTRTVKYEDIISITDAIGLGVFTALGSNTAMIHCPSEPFLVITMGLITGVGGGILRDVFVKDIPFVFKKEIYAVASIMGAFGVYFTHGYVPEIVSLYICFGITFIVRILALRFKINLPVANIEKKQARSA